MICFLLLGAIQGIGQDLEGPDLGELVVKASDEMNAMPPRHDAAAKAWEACAELAKEQNDDYIWVYSRLFTASSYQHLGVWDSVRNIIFEMEEVLPELRFATSEKPKVRADYSFILAKYFRHKGIYDASMNYSQQAVDLLLELAGENEEGQLDYTRIGYGVGFLAADYLNDLAMEYVTMGDYEKAKNYYEMGLRVTEESQYANNVTINPRQLNNLGLVYLEINRPDKALFLLREAQEAQNKLNKGELDEYDQETQGLIDMSLAQVHLAKKDWAKAEEYIDKALEVSINSRFKIRKLRVHLELIAQDEGLKAAKTAFDGLFDLTEQEYGSFHPLMLDNYKVWAGLLLDDNQLSESELMYNKGVNVLRRMDSDECDCRNVRITDLSNKIDALELFEKKAEILLKKESLTEALDCYSLIQRIFSQLMTTYVLNEQSKLFLIERMKGVNETAIRTAIRNNDTARAYEFSQQSRSMLLLQQIQQGQTLNTMGLPETVLKQGRRLQITVQELLKERRAAEVANDSKTFSTISNRYFGAVRAYEEWESNLESDYPDYFKMKHELPSISVSELQQWLKKRKTTLLEYFLGEDYLFVFIVDGRQLNVETIHLDDAFRFNIHHLKEAVRHPKMDQESVATYVRNAHIVYQELIGQFEEKGLVSHENLLVVPDGELNLLPFEALLKTTSGAESHSFGFLDYALNHYNISYTYNSRLLRGNDGSRDKVQFLGVAPSFNESIQELEFNQEEVRAINAIYKGEGLLGARGNYQNFEDAVKSANILHMATHAIFDDQIPLASKIELMDTSMYLYQIATMEHQLDLAVLSACQTASGKERKGEGLISLTRAFIRSGCPNVIASLWDVSDRKAFDITRDFHSNFREKDLPISLSLTKAKRKYLADATNFSAHPFFWSGLVYVGEESGVLVSNWNYLIGFGVLFSILFLILVYRKYFI